MKFIDPSLKEVYKTISGNKELVNYLLQEGLLLTKEQFYEIKTTEEIKHLDTYIYTENVRILYDVAQILLDNKEEIESKDLWELCSNKVAFKEIAESFGIPEDNFNIEHYKRIIYTFKYSFVSSFFQNNKDKFFSEIDFEEIEENAALKAFTDAIMKEFDKFDNIISKCSEYRDFDKIPQDLINYLSQLVGFEKGNLNITEKDEGKYREIIKSIIDLYRVKGTNYSFEVFFKFLGYNIEVKEFYFDRRMLYSTTGNPHTSEQDKLKFGYYLVPQNPVDNELSTTTNEYVTHQDFTPQYSLSEFDDLVEEYGIEAVLGYTNYDKNNKEYTGKVYKYFKTNVIYYSVALDHSNPNEKETAAINKVLAFLTPAYVMKTTNIEVYTGSSQNSVADNTIFFDRTVDLEALEAEIPEDSKANEESNEALRKSIREFIRNTYPIMLDSEKRDSQAGMDIYTVVEKDAEGNLNLKVIHDNGSEEPYKNTGNNVDYKEKIPMKVGGITEKSEYAPIDICLNTDRMITEESPKADQLSKIKELFKNLNFKEDLNSDYIISSRMDYFYNNDQSLNKLIYSPTYINTLFLRKEISQKFKNPSKELNEKIKKEIKDKIDNLNRIYTFCNDEKHILEVNSSEEFINPYSLDKEIIEKLNVHTQFLCVILEKQGETYTGIKYLIYEYGPASPASKKYTDSFDIRLVETQRLYRFRGRRVGLNVPTSLKVERNTLDELYKAIKEDNDGKGIRDTDHYFYEKSRNAWYYSIKKARLVDNIINSKKYKSNFAILPDDKNIHGIPIVYKKIMDGIPKYSLIEPSVDTEGIWTVEEPYDDIDSLFVGNNIEAYNHFIFYLDDIDKEYDSDLYEYKYLNKVPGKRIYCTQDDKFYELDDSYKGYHVISPDGLLDKDENGNYSIYRFDKYWQGYDELDEKDSYVLYNNRHNIVWNNVGIDGYNHYTVYSTDGKTFYDDPEMVNLADIPAGIKPTFIAGKEYTYRYGKNRAERPTKERTDKFIDNDKYFRERVEKDIFCSSFFLLSEKMKLQILGNEVFKKGKENKGTSLSSYISAYELLYLIQENLITGKQIKAIEKVLATYTGTELGPDSGSNPDKRRRPDTFYGNPYPNGYYLFKDFIYGCDNGKCIEDDTALDPKGKDRFVKDYCYAGLLERWRTADLIEDEVGEINNRNLFDKYDSLIEKFNGKPGKLLNTNTANNFYRGNTSYNVEFYKTEKTESDYKFFIKRGKLTGDITNLLVAYPNFENSYYSYPNHRVQKIEQVGDDYIVYLKDFKPFKDEAPTGYLTFNRLEQKLIDNILNHPTSAYENNIEKDIIVYSENGTNFYSDKKLLDEVNIEERNLIHLYGNEYLYHSKEPIESLLKISKSLGREWSNNGDDRVFQVTSERITKEPIEINIESYAINQYAKDYDIEFDYVPNLRETVYCIIQSIVGEREDGDYNIELVTDIPTKSYMTSNVNSSFVIKDVKIYKINFDDRNKEA